MPDIRGAGGSVAHEARADIGGFKKFLLRGNVVDLAVGVVIGAAFGSVVQAIVKDILNPIISAFGGVSDVSALSVTAGRITFPIGDLINAIITFFLIALVVYFVVVLPVNKLMDRYKPQPQPAPTKDCPECTNKIPKATVLEVRPTSRSAARVAVGRTSRQTVASDRGRPNVRADELFGHGPRRCASCGCPRPPAPTVWADTR